MGFMKKEYSDGFFNVGKKNGFLPQQKPLETLPKRYSKLQEYVFFQNISHHLYSHSFYQKFLQ